MRFEWGSRDVRARLKNPGWFAGPAVGTAAEMGPGGTAPSPRGPPAGPYRVASGGPVFGPLNCMRRGGGPNRPPGSQKKRGDRLGETR